MKRQRRIKLTGRIDGRRRRRALRLLRLAYPFGDESTSYRQPVDFRDARRLAEAGLAVVAATKRWWGVGHAKEITLFSTVAAARARYPRTVAPFGRSWNSPPANKPKKKGSALRASKRLMRQPLIVPDDTRA